MYPFTLDRPATIADAATLSAASGFHFQKKVAVRMPAPATSTEKIMSIFSIPLSPCSAAPPSGAAACSAVAPSAAAGSPAIASLCATKLGSR